MFVGGKISVFVVMKDGKYFTGEVAPSAAMELIRWTRHPAEAKIWKRHRYWAQKAARQWGGTVVECDKVSTLARSLT